MTEAKVLKQIEVIYFIKGYIFIINKSNLQIFKNKKNNIFILYILFY